LGELRDRRDKLQSDFDDINNSYEGKLAELEEIRLRANEDIKKMSGELGAV
jgi:molecular chaperone GrpE (heat shock protein)